MAFPVAPQSVQRSIGEYTYDLSHEIGSGSSSKVYRCKKAKTDSYFAVKVIDLKKYNSTNIEMLENEVRILKQLDHPHVLKCYDTYKTSSKFYIVTDLCKEGDLHSHLSARGKLKESEAI